jgi:Zn-dependent peptidase ImmA (M78 family)
MAEYASTNPTLLRWARETSGYDVPEVARRIGVKPDKLERAEQFTEMLTIPQLRNLAQVYRRPIDIFYLPEPPASLPEPQDFRTVMGAFPQQLNLSPKLRLVWRRAHLRRTAALELLAEQGETPLSIDIRARASEDPDVVARRVTRWLNITQDNRPYNREPREMLNMWISIIEARGVLVFQSSDFEIDEARALSYWAPQLPFILLNGKDLHRPRLFSLLHECAHLLLREAGAACNPMRSGANLNPVERFCNQVAAAILIPFEDLHEHKLVAHRQSVPASRWTDSDIQVLANAYGVSRQVVLLRLLDLKLAENTFVQEKLLELEAVWQSHISEPKPETSGGPPPFRMALRDNGRRYCQIVLSAVDRNLLSEIDAADYLNLKTKHFDRVRDALEAGEVVG